MPNMTNAIGTILDKVKARPPKNESETIHLVILPLLEQVAGYERYDLSLEYSSDAGRTDIYYHRDNPGCSLWIEVKDWNTALDDKHAGQLLKYVNDEGGRWGVLTNGKEWRLYDCHMSHLRAKDRVVLKATIDDVAHLTRFLSVISKPIVDQCQVEAQLRPLRLRHLIEEFLLNPEAGQPIFDAVSNSLVNIFGQIQDDELKQAINTVRDRIVERAQASVSPPPAAPPSTLSAPAAPPSTLSAPVAPSPTLSAPAAPPSTLSASSQTAPSDASGLPTQPVSWKDAYIEIVKHCYQVDPEKIIDYLKKRGELYNQPRVGASGHTLTTRLDSVYHFYTTLSSDMIQTRLHEIAELFGLSGTVITVRGEPFIL